MPRYNRHDAAQNRHAPVRPSSAFWADGFMFDGELQNQGMRHMLLNWQPSIINDNDDPRTRVLKHAILLFRQVNHYLSFVDVPEFADVITQDGGWPHYQGKPIIKRYELARRCYARQPRQIPAKAGDLDIVLCRLVDNYIDAKACSVRMDVTGARNQYILHIRDSWCQAMKAGLKAILDAPPQIPALPARQDWLPGAAARGARRLSRSPPPARHRRRSLSPLSRRSRSPCRYTSRSPPRYGDRMSTPIRHASRGTGAAYRPGEPAQQQHAGYLFRPPSPMNRAVDLPVRPSPDREAQHYRRMEQSAHIDQERREAEAREARERAEVALRAEIQQAFMLIGISVKSVSVKVRALALREDLSPGDRENVDFLQKFMQMSEVMASKGAGQRE